MGVLQRFERRLGGLVEGAFARVFKGGVEPVELAGALTREADDRRAIGANRTLVPNDYIVVLSPKDHDHLAPYAEPLGAELADMVTEHAGREQYTFVGPVTVRFARDESLDLGVFQVRSGVVTPGGAPAGRPAPAYAPPAPVPAAGPPAAPYPPPTAYGPPPEPAWTQGVRAAASARYQQGAGALLVTGTDGTHRRHELGDVTVIGRGSEADVQLTDTGVSRQHAEIRREAGGAIFTDLGSTNGSTVNGRQVRRAELRDGDRIELGTTVLSYRAEDRAGPERGGAAAWDGGRQADDLSDRPYRG